MSKIVLVTGCSSGIGRATAIFLAQKGYKVYAGMRNITKNILSNDSIIEIELDVTNDDSVSQAISNVIGIEGQIDILINNAGYGLIGPMETITIEDAKKEFDVNFFGLMRVTQQVLPHMRNQKSGIIVNISSIAGVKAKFGSDLYNASKFAVEGLSEAMAPYLIKQGIRVILIEPGPVNTNFTSTSMKFGTEHLEDYKELDEKIKRVREGMFKNAQGPEEVAKVIHDAILDKTKKLRYQTSESIANMVGLKHIDPSGEQQLLSQIEELK